MKNEPFALRQIWQRALFVAATLLFMVTLSWAQVANLDQKLQQLNEIEQEIEDVDRLIKNADNDNTLIGARTTLLDLQTRVDEVVKPVEDRLAVISSQLDVLGTAPPPGESESPQVAEERAEAQAERKQLRIISTKADEIDQKIIREYDQIAQMRRQIFASRLSQRSPITLSLLTNIGSESVATFSRFQAKLRTWWTVKIAPNPAPLFLVGALFAVLLAGAYVLSRRASNVLSQGTSRLNALIYIFVTAMVPSVLLAVALAVSYWVMDFTSLFTLDLRGFVGTLFMVLLGLFFVLRLTYTFLAPHNADLRIVPFSSFAAQRTYVLVSSLAVVHALDHLAGRLGQLVNAPLAFTIGNSFLAAFLIALLLLALARVRDNPEDPHSRTLPAWVRIPLLLASIAIIVAAVAGYIGLARFMAQQLVVTGTILVTGFFGYLLAQELGKPGVLVSTRSGRWLQNRLSLDESDIDQYALFTSIGFLVLIVMIMIPAILLQWGSRVEDVVTWVRQAIIGFQIGSFEFSLASVFYGGIIFVLGLVLTRIFQRWLGNTVLERTRADHGVKDSIRTGVGYVGIALSIFLGITGAGVDLGSLAIVAGALSLGIGFGLQNVVSNFVSGLIMLVERPIKVGDFVEASGFSGTVSKISVRATEINTIHNQTIIIPNSEFINAPVGNWTHKIRSGRVDIPIGVAYGSDLEKVNKILLEIAQDHDNVLKRPEPFVFFQGFGDSSINFQLRIHVNDYTIYPRVQTDILFAIDKAFREQNVEIPFPQRDLHLRSADPKIMEKLGGASASRPKPRAATKPKSET
ncbi:mechanosensitive ion channel domain-containing protein [Maritalea mediterranea]|uniref:Mechanosensitive ion channel n=1 Tax=Maritalea mediterranea TaxID=2909667 RepID=A0ABS9E998_9HYPH|nr:mechanosensitive ion channel domain-containing protein [Maritalea mediterranea]MCF4098011.1 mechanosensitive ion channel [Maritalea mediterranea]